MSGFISALGRDVFKLAFEKSPIILNGGLASNIPGGMLPLIVITEAAHLLTGLLSGTDNIELDNFFASFAPLSGSTLIDYQIGEYPFANQAVAGNALIKQPLMLSMTMQCPARDVFGYPLKLLTMTALKQALDTHADRGGTYTVLTPSYFYTNGVLLTVRDVTSGQSKQVQSAWQFDFRFPLITLLQIEAAQNSLMSKLTNGTQVTNSSWSGPAPTVGAPGSLAAPAIVPTASSTPAVAPPMGGP